MVEPEHQHLVLYDGDCPFCIAQMRLLSRLDWSRRFKPLSASDPQARRAVPGVTEAALSEAIHCVSVDGRVQAGARCIRFVALRLPLLAPLGLLLWIPGMIFVAERIYPHVSRNRMLLGRFFGCKDACGVTPRVQRDEEIIR